MPAQPKLEFMEMAQPANVTMPSYYIYRNEQAGQPFDPTSLVFVPPKDSDELFDALRVEFPHLKSHSERMREAVISFLVNEVPTDHILNEPLQAQQLPTPQTMRSTTTSPWQPSFTSISSDSSTWSSPEDFELATPTFGESPLPQPVNRQMSAATSTVASNESSPPALEQMTGVFSLAKLDPTEAENTTKDDRGRKG